MSSLVGSGRFGAGAAATVTAILLIALNALGVGAQVSGEPARSWRIGVLFWHDSPNDHTAFSGFKRGVEAARRTVVFDVRDAGEDEAKAVRHLAAFRKAGVDAVLALGTVATRIASVHVRDRPVLFTAVTDPIAAGLVPSWRGSGTNLAGNSNHIDPHRVVTDVRRAFPKLRLLGVVHVKGNAVSANEIRGLRAALETRASLGIRLKVRAVETPAEILDATKAILAEVDALWIPIDFAVYGRAAEVAAIARKHGKPIVTTTPKAMQHAVVSILSDYGTLGMQAAAIANRVLRKEAEPGAMPIGTLRGRWLVLNLRAARAIDLALPVRAMGAADRIIPAGRP